MNWKEDWWKIVAVLLVGIFIGFVIDFPNKFEIKIEVVNETREWWEVQTQELYNLSDYWENRTNTCCYPSDCEQAKRNPEQCTCIYMVECFEEGELK